MDLMLIDANSIGYTGQYTRPLKVDNEPVQAIFFFLKEIRSLCEKYPNHYPLILWDKHCQWRYDLMPDYKSKRDVDPEQKRNRDEYKAQKPIIKKLAYLFGLTQVSCEGEEADDLAGYLSRHVRKEQPNSRVLLVSKDHDWLQLVDELTSWYDFAKKNLVTLSKFEQETGYAQPVDFLIGKSLQGDTSDTIPGVGGIGEKAALLIAQEGGLSAVTSIYKRDGEFTKENIPASLSRYKKKLNDFCSNANGGTDKFKINMQLMNLMSDRPLKGEINTVNGNVNKDALIDLLMELNFATVIGQLDNYLQTFGQTTTLNTRSNAA